MATTKTVFTSQPTSSANNTVSRYVQGGVTDVYANRLGWWDGFTFPPSSDDVSFTLESKYNQRPDLLAYDMYGKSLLVWFVLQYNGIVDINEEFITGAVIRLPTKSRLFSSIMIYQEGGNVVNSQTTS
jgi:hypothetical protein